MDEDHSRLRTRPVPSARRTPKSPASPPRSVLRGGGGASDAFSGDGSWSTADPQPRRPSFVDTRPPASAGRGSYPTSDKGYPDADGAEAEAGAVEMVCVDAVDLADIITVRQEELAPEQVTRFCFAATPLNCSSLGHQII